MPSGPTQCRPTVAFSNRSEKSSSRSAGVAAPATARLRLPDFPLLVVSLDDCISGLAFGFFSGTGAVRVISTATNYALAFCYHWAYPLQRYVTRMPAPTARERTA